MNVCKNSFKIRIHFFWRTLSVAMLLYLVPLVYAATPANAASLLASFTSTSPLFPSYAAFVIMALVLANGEFLCLHYLQLLETHQNTISAWMCHLRHSIFLAVPNTPGLGEQQQDTLIRQIADSLELSHEFVLDNNLFHPALLGPSFPECQVCGAWLQTTRKPLDIWILEDDGARKGKLLQGNCSSQNCRVSHFPDRYRCHVNGKLTSLYNSNAVYIRIGGKVWANRQLASTQSHLRYATHISSERFASFYSERYGRIVGFEMTPMHAWRLFVLHESLKLCQSAFSELAWPSYTDVAALCQKMQDQYFPGAVKIIPGALEHECNDCVHPFWQFTDNNEVQMNFVNYFMIITDYFIY